MKWNSDWTAESLSAEILAAIPTAEVKTASAVGNGKLIQVRVSWTDNRGKRKVGTLSAQTSYIRKYTANTSEQHFIASVFGLITKSIYLHGFQHKVADEVVARVMEEVMRSYAVRRPLEKLRRAAAAAMAAVAAGDGPERIAKTKRLARATEGLRSWLSEALKAGLKDSELKKIMREEMVRLVHEA